MAARTQPSRGGKPDKLMRDAIIIALNREAEDADGKKTKRLQTIAEKLVELAASGEVMAIKEVCDRVDGKPAQAVIGDADNPLEMIHTIERVIVENAKD